MNLILIIIGLFILGSIFGSFGSVLVTRLGEGVDRHILHGIFFGFSHCPKCKKQLQPKNLIPIISFFLQRGMCEDCKQPISKFYPMLEILSGLTFVLTYLLTNSEQLTTNSIGVLIFFLLINRLLLLLIVYDFQKLELHVPLRVVAVAVSLLGQFIFPIGNYGQAFYLSLIFGGICVGLFFGAMWYVRKRYKKKAEGFGQGDVMLGFLIGTLMPFVFSFNTLIFSRTRIFELLILFFVLSSILGLAWYGIMKLTTNDPASSDGAGLQLTVFNYKLPKINCALLPVNSKLKVLPFIPFMIFAFWILLFFGKYFISLLFPRG